MSLRKLAQFDFYGMYSNEPGMGRMPPREQWLILNQVWPEVSEGSRGNAVMAPEDAERLEKLFLMFGVPMKVAENSLEIVGRAYDVFALALEPWVGNKFRYWDSFDRFAHDWPEDWRKYIEAVAREDHAEARQWAVKLQPLSPDCVFPPGVPTPADFKRDAERWKAEEEAKKRSP
ncbi:hypothetical protein [Ramlibacter alkalitolerans]|uniref:Uncharacterized protein n=1 Tax=Ramlibacter alkalitolerans TaxID=2039631 RepID=A0ABS1JTY5_9BURK|nr:hypothetical protein [Ramlibacter alkalitolerans]MBL0427745.1 hypothetical protein [Ramlibacter alkalitolerans]